MIYGAVKLTISALDIAFVDASHELTALACGKRLKARHLVIGLQL
ncbi:MAG: hypothetical protein ACREDJ_04160 [Methylocella sp.]